jgi:hypothetical protein
MNEPKKKKKGRGENKKVEKGCRYTLAVLMHLEGFT